LAVDERVAFPGDYDAVISVDEERIIVSQRVVVHRKAQVRRDVETVMTVVTESVERTRISALEKRTCSGESRAADTSAVQMASRL